MKTGWLSLVLVAGIAHASGGSLEPFMRETLALPALPEKQTATVLFQKLSAIRRSDNREIFERFRVAYPDFVFPTSFVAPVQGLPQDTRPGDSGKSPAPWGSSSNAYLSALLSFFQKLENQNPNAAFDISLIGSSVLLIGVSDGLETFDFIRLFPHVAEVHVVNIDTSVFDALEETAQAFVLEGLRIPLLFSYGVNFLDFPEERLKNSFDLIISVNVFDGSYFDGQQLRDIGRKVSSLLRSPGFYLHYGGDFIPGLPLEHFTDRDSDGNHGWLKKST